MQDVALTDPLRNAATRWSHLAQWYDAGFRLYGRRYPEVIRRLTRDLAGAERVLEVAAGTGAVTVALASAAREVVATDISDDMLARLAHKLCVAEAFNVDVLARDAHDLGFRDECFDGVVCVNGIHVIPEPTRTLAEMVRVVRPGGLVVVPTFCHSENSLARGISWVMQRAASFRVFTPFSREMLGQQLEIAGLEVEHLEDLGGPLPLVYAAARKPER